MLGQFLEISIHCDSVLESVQFFERLGFRQLNTLDTWTHHYGVVSDGRLHLGLHGYEFDSPSLTFVAKGLAPRVPELEAHGVTFEFCKLADNEFHEAGFLDTDGHMVCLLEARTYTPAETGAQDESLCGYFTEYRLPTRNAVARLEFWEQLGLLPGESGEGFATVHATGINLGFDEDSRQRQPLLRFEHTDIDRLAAELEQRDIAFRKHPEGGLRIQAPQVPDLVIVPTE